MFAARSELFPGDAERFGGDSVVEAPATEKGANFGEEFFVGSSEVPATTLEGEVRGELEVVDAIDGGSSGLGIDAAPEQLVAKHGAAPGREALAVFDPGAGEAGVIEEAGGSQPLDFEVDGFGVEATQGEAGAHFVFGAGPCVEESEGGFVGVGAAFFAVEQVEELGVGEHALGEASTLTGLVGKHEFAAVAEGDDAEAPPAGGTHRNNGGLLETG